MLPSVHVCLPHKLPNESDIFPVITVHLLHDVCHYFGCLALCVLCAVFPLCPRGVVPPGSPDKPTPHLRVQHRHHVEKWHCVPFKSRP